MIQLCTEGLGGDATTAWDKLLESDGGDLEGSIPGVGRGDCQGSGRVSTGFVGVYGAERVAAVQGRLREVAGQVD